MTGSDLRKRRRQLRLTQAALAELFGYDPNTIARWERGQAEIGHPKLVLMSLKWLQRLRDDRREAAGLD